MASKLDLSLDDITKATRKKSGGARGGRGGRGRGGARGGRGGRGGRSSSRGRGGRQRPTPYSRPNNAPNRTAMLAAQQKSRLVGATKVSVSNLAPEVTKDDVEEIFQQVGPVKSAVVHYNQEGRSVGTAEVTFKNKGSAEKAVQEYDRAEVDGRPMYIRLLASIAPSVKLAAPRANRQQAPPPRRGAASRGRGASRGARGGRGRAASAGRGRGGKAGRGRGGKGGRGGKAKPATAASLDAEMDAYHAKAASSPADTTAAAGQPSTAAAGQPTIPDAYTADA